MENSQSLATESFSYSWLINKNSSFHGLGECNEVITPKEKQRFLEEAQNFNFDIPITKSSVTLSHADEIFSDGHFIPIYLNRSKRNNTFNATTSIPTIPISSLSSRSVCQSDGAHSHCHFLKKWRKSSNRILQKCFELLRPLSRRIGCSRKSIRVDDIDRKVWEVQSMSNSLQASPPRGDWSDSDIKQISNTIDIHMRLRKVESWSNFPVESPLQSPTYSTNVLCEIESSIYEAVLHCKRSIGK